MADDSALITSARAGDQQAFAALHRTHYRRALHEARKILPNRLDVEDCVSAAFASTFMAMRKGGGPTEAFRPYLLTSVRNSALQLVRLRRYTSEQATDEIEPEPHVDLYEIGADPAVRNAFQGLPDRWREVLWKTEIEGRAPRELAEELAMSANSVAALAKRARDGFRKAYLTEAVGPDPHPWAVERLDAYRAGTLEPRERDLVELHVEHCARCEDIVAPVPISAASIGIVLLAAGAGGPALGAVVGATGGATLMGRIRRLRPSGKSAAAAAVTAAAVGLLAVVVVARSDDRPANAPSVTVASPRGAAPELVGSVPSAEVSAAAPAASAVTAPAVVTVATVPDTDPATSPAATDPAVVVLDATDPPTTRRRVTTTTRRPRPTVRPTVATTTVPATAGPTDPPPSDPPADPAPTAAPPAVAPAIAPTEPPVTPAPTEAPATTAATTTTRAPVYGGTLGVQRNPPNYVVTVRATAADGLPAGTFISVALTSTEAWSVTFTGTSNCNGMPAVLSGAAGQTLAATCTTPALPSGTAATVALTTQGAAAVSVAVTAQRPGGNPACDPPTAC